MEYICYCKNCFVDTSHPSKGEIDRRSTHSSSNAVFCVGCQRRCDQITSFRRSKRASAQIAFYAFHSFLVLVQTNDGYIRRLGDQDWGFLWSLAKRMWSKVYNRHTVTFAPRVLALTKMNFIWGRNVCTANIKITRNHFIQLYMSTLTQRGKTVKNNHDQEIKVTHQRINWRKFVAVQQWPFSEAAV